MTTVETMPTGKAAALNDLEREVRALVRRVRRQSALNARSIHPELQATAYFILLHVFEHEPARAAHIVDDLGIDKGAVSRKVTQLERLGLLERTTDPLDGRARTLVVSDLGQTRLQELERERRSAFTGRLASWTGPELAHLADGLSSYNASLEA